MYTRLVNYLKYTERKGIRSHDVLSDFLLKPSAIRQLAVTVRRHQVYIHNFIFFAFNDLANLYKTNIKNLSLFLNLKNNGQRFQHRSHTFKEQQSGKPDPGPAVLDDVTTLTYEKEQKQKAILERNTF